MPRRKHNLNIHVADPEAFAVRKEPIPLRAVGRTAVRDVVYALPELLDFGHFLADRGRRARLVLQIACSGEVVGMRMRIKNPLQLIALAFDMTEQLVG